MAITGFTTTENLRRQATIIDPVAIHEAFLKMQKGEEEEAAHKAMVEKNRIDQMECPVCKSNDKSKNNLIKDNGVFGPGFESHVVLTYYVCNDCGVHYSDLNKKK
jgi:transposase-like protein